MNSKQDDNHRRNKKINKGKKFDTNRKKNLLIEDPNDNYNELSYGAFENISNDITNNKKTSLENNDIVNYEDEIKKVNIINNDNNNEDMEVFTEDYFEPIVYNNDKNK